MMDDNYMKYVMKAYIDAIQWNGLNLEKVKEFVDDKLSYYISDSTFEEHIRNAFLHVPILNDNDPLSQLLSLPGKPVSIILVVVSYPAIYPDVYAASISLCDLKGTTVSAPGIIYPYEVPLTPKAILSVLVLEVLKVTVLVDRPDRVS